MMAHDRYLYDLVTRDYTVDKYVDDVEHRYGGLDAVLIWPTYPNMGIDDRNQYDLLRDMPGGIAGIKKMISAFHTRGIKVFFPIMIWDHGTRKIKLKMPVALDEEMKLIGADGLNGDTMAGVTEDFINASDSLQYPLVLQPEWGMKNLKMVEWNLLSWGYYWNYTYTPGISIYKWLEPRHQVNITNRWATDKTDDLQYAFFNGVGYNTWENIWGTWNEIPDLDKEVIRRIRTIYNAFPDLWSAEWEPYLPTLKPGVFASSFKRKNITGITLVNRDRIDYFGNQLKIPHEEGKLYLDLWNGNTLSPVARNGVDFIDFPIESEGYGAILKIDSSSLNERLNNLLKKMHEYAAKPLKSFSSSWSPLKQEIVPIVRISGSTIPENMLLIPAAKNYLFASEGVMIEGDRLPDAVGVQHPWQQHPSRSQKHNMDIPAFYIDKYPVTNKQFKAFLVATQYHPVDTSNFLRDWQNGNFPKGWDLKPVTWVSLEDGRAYAAWAGKRLPHEWEWQYAAQATDGRHYPWGNEYDEKRVPPMDSSRNMRPPTNVNKFPEGASPFGVLDMVGNVWQWTDEYWDEHTRYAILKGGGYYRSTTSDWYFPHAYELHKYGKYLLMAPGLDRSRCIGFRCVMDK